MPLHTGSKSILLKVILAKANKQYKCQHLKEDYINYDTIDGHIILEYDIVCKDCGKHLGHWAHGYEDRYDQICPKDYEVKILGVPIDFDSEDPFDDLPF